MKFVTRRTARRGSGASLVEFAIVVPLLFLIVALAWSEFVALICHIRHESAALQIELNFQDSALKAGIGTDPSSGIPEVILTKLGVDDIDELITLPQGFLPRFNLLFNNIMNNIGTFSNLVPHNIALALWYIKVCDGIDLTPPCNLPQNLGRPIPGQVLPAGTEQGAPQRFFTAPGGDICFGAPGSTNYIKIKAKFDQYVQNQINMITDAAAPDPFGVQILDIPQLPGVSAIKAYLQIKPVVFVAMCSDPPTLLPNQAPIVTYSTIVLDGGLSF